MSNIDEINMFIQNRLNREILTTVISNVAAIWLDEAGLLKDRDLANLLENY